MIANTPRYLIENQGPDRGAIKTAFAGAVQVCEKLEISEITLLVPAKGQFQTTVVGAFLGSGASKALCKGEAVKLTAKLSMNLESSRTYSPYKSYGMVIGVYLSKKDQAILDSTTSAKALVLLPWTEEDGKTWLSTWNPEVLGASTWQVEQTAFPEDVENILRNLTGAINLSSGLSHPSDKAAAKQALSNLKKNGHMLHPEDVRKWAVRNNWSPKDAEALRKLAGQYFK